MKYILIFALSFIYLIAADKKQKLTIGAGPYLQTQPYKDVATIFVPSPVIFFDNSLFYVRWTRVGMYFLGNKGDEFSWGLSLTAQPRTFGYKAEETASMKGMDDRKTSLEGGLALSAVYNDVNMEILALTDLIERYDLWVVSTNIGYEYTLSKFTFYPSIGATYQSKEFLNYYYGVKRNEATLSRPFYAPNKAGLALTAQTYINYTLTDSLDILFNARADYIPKSVQESPLLESNYIYSGLISLLYTFEY